MRQVTHILMIVLCTFLATACGSDDAKSDYQAYCTSDGDCVGDQICDAGFCVTPVCNCTSQYAPVCGDDGVTYANSCMASCQQVTIARSGECERLCMSNAECAPGQRCTAGEECLTGTCPDDACDAVCFGRCVTEGCPCPDVIEPVCGSNNVTYDNECLASCAGLEVLHFGACGMTCDPTMCPDVTCPYGWGLDPADCSSCACVPLLCASEADCGTTLVCDPDACVPSCEGCKDCNAACVDPAALCLCEPGEPVCGIDGRTYASDCDADCRAIEVAHEGECQPQCGVAPMCEIACEWGYKTDAMGCPTCECQADARVLCADSRDCAQTEWCNPSACAPSCLACTDCRPACETMPCACPELWDPVCDMSGWTWANACEADCAGVSSVRRGACGSSCSCPPGQSAVCGVDGKTYGGTCIATCAGVEVAWSGTCDAPTLCTANDPTTCGPGYRCNEQACAPSCLGCDDCNPACVYLE